MSVDILTTWAERFALLPVRLSSGRRIWLRTYLERRGSKDLGFLNLSWTETKMPGDADPVRRCATLRRAVP